METFAKISLLAFGILMFAGGVMGFLKAKSKASLLAGLVSGSLLIVAHSVSNRNPKNGFMLGAGITSMLAIVFTIRLVKTKKFMPSGMLLVLTVLEEMLLLVAAFIRF